MGSHYGFIREQLTAGTDFTISVGAGGTTTTGGTLWLALYSENRQGLNLASALTQVTWVAGQKVTITINASARATGEEPFRYTLAGAATNTPANLQQLAFIWAIDPADQITPEAFPLTLELTRDQDFVLGGSVAAAANLPTSPLDGAMRSAIAEGLRYEANGGTWTATTKPFSTYLTSTIEANGARVGCDRPLNQISTAAIIQPLPYTPDGSLQASPIRFDYSNGLAATAGPVLRKGTSMVFQLFVAGQDVSTRFSGKFLVTFLGYVNRATGVLNTALSGVGAAIPYEFFLSGSGQLVGSNILLPADLDRGEAAAYRVALRVNADELNATGEPIADNSEVEILLSPVAPRGFYDSAYSLTGDLVYADEDNQFLRIVPDPAGVNRLGGSCTIARYTSPLVDAQLVGGFLADTADQQIAIDATLGAQATLRAPGAPLLSTEALRALVGTEPGSYTASAWSSPVALVAGQNLNISITHPTAVRSNYPDVIAGMAAVFNAPRIRIFVRLSGVVYELPTPATTIPGGPANSVTVSDISGWTSGATLPNSSGTPSFCAFGYSTLTATASGAGSSLSDGSYEVAVAWHYPSPNTRTTTFDHSTGSGCIPEATATFGELLSSVGKVAVSTVDTTPDYLYPKLVAGTGITLTKLNPGANEQIQIDGSLQLTIENEGTPLPQRNNLNFVGPAVTVTDSAPDTVVTVAPFQTFTGSPSAVTPTETGQLWIATDSNKVYRSTGTTLGALVEVSASAGDVASIFGRTGAVVAQSGDYTATQVTNTPAGSIAATTVQSALNELDTEKQALIQWQNEGINQGTAGPTEVNVTGDGATVSVSGGVATINVPGGGGLTPVYVTAATVSGVAGNLYQIAGTTTLNLPAGVNGDQIAIIDQLPNFTAAPLTINPNGAQTIAGQSSLVLDRDNACVWLVFYGTNWAIVAAESFTDYSAGGGNSLATRTGVYREIWVGAGAMTPRTTNGAAIATVETATNDITYDVLDFDATTSEGACFQISMPDSWDRGTVKARFYWTATSGSGTVTWAIKGGSLSDDDLLDTAYGTAQSVTDTLLATTDLHVTTATPALTVASSPALQDWVYFEVSRDVADTLAADARLIGVKIQYLELTTEPTGW